MCGTYPPLGVTNLVHHTASWAILFSSFFPNNFESIFCSSEETFVGGWWDRKFISLGFEDQHFEYERGSEQFSGPIGDGGPVRFPTGVPGFLLSAYPKITPPQACSRLPSLGRLKMLWTIVTYTSEPFQPSCSLSLWSAFTSQCLLFFINLWWEWFLEGKIPVLFSWIPLSLDMVRHHGPQIHARWLALGKSPLSRLEGLLGRVLQANLQAATDEMFCL